MKYERHQPPTNADHRGSKPKILSVFISVHRRLILVALCAGILASQPSGREQVGRLADGSFLLSTGWRIKPVGAQVPLDTLPMASALSSDGKFLLVLNGGYRPPSVSVIDTASMKETSRVPVADGWLGLAFSPDGRRVYVGGGSQYSVLEFAFSAAGELKPSRTFLVGTGAKPGEKDFIGDVAVSPDGRLLYAADLYHDSVVVINPQTEKVEGKIQTGRRPYRILFHPDGKTIFVSSWADATVFQYDALNGNEMNRVRLGPHTTDMVLSTRKIEDDDTGVQFRLYVTASNTNSVYVVSVSDTKNIKLMETLNVAMSAREPAGMTPSGLALSPDQTRLFVVCSDANVVAAADITGARARMEGFIPTGWYPTAARVLRDGRVLVLNGRGLGSFANPKPAPERWILDGSGTADVRTSYIPYMQTGTMSVIDPLTDEALDGYTKAAIELSPYRDAYLDVANLPGNSVIYSRPGRPSPIEHVIYVVKENRTYDEVFGKMGKGNSDPSLTLFDETTAPNHYKLAREFVLFDNYYSNADVSADGHNWAMAGIAPDYTQRTWPSNYAHRSPYYGYEGTEPANSPPAGYIWSNAVSAGLSVRNYGEFTTVLKPTAPDGTQVKVDDPSLVGITNMKYRGWDTDYPDVERVKAFIDDVKQFDAGGAMPRFMIVRLGNDHTAYTAPGKIAPRSMFADNDAALGQLVEAVSRSRFWSKTAIFVIEDDAQNGPDHVDSHRSLLLALSPYTRRGVIDSTFYNQSSVLRTMELILGLRPMTHFDAAGRPLAAAFAAQPNAAPYQAEPPHISLTERNPEKSPTVARSLRFDLDQPDMGDDEEANRILWLALKNSAPPAPVRSYFSRQ